jgi:TonB family protein
MKAEVILVNRSDQRLISAGLQFANALTGEVFYCYPNELTVGAGRRGRFRIPLMMLTGDPAQFAISAVGALFADSSIWGSYPYPPPLKAGTKLRFAAAVDREPELISSIHPTFTEEARRNRVKGAVRLGLEIGSDGAVRGLEVLNALPDGLTDEAVRIAHRLIFRPAIRSGEPVPCQISLDIEFKGG